MIELPVRDPCDLCEVASREDRWAILDESEHTLTVINPWQFEVGQCCVITRRHVATLLDLSREECEAILVAAKRVAEALVRAYNPLGILTFQNNGVYSGAGSAALPFPCRAPPARERLGNWPAATRHVRRRRASTRYAA